MIGRSIFAIHKGPFLAALVLALPIGAQAQFFGGGGAQLVDALPDHCTAGQLFVLKPAVGLTSNLGQQMYYCTKTGSATYARILAAEPLPNPGTPFALAHGSGVNHYAYQIVAFTSDGAHTAASDRYPAYPVQQGAAWVIPAGGTVLLNGALNGTTLYNDVVWGQVAGASYCRVYQIVNDKTQGTGIVTDVTTGKTDIPCSSCSFGQCSLRDGGTYTPATPPTTNTTGRTTLSGGACDPSDPTGTLCAGGLRLSGNGIGAALPATCTVGAVYFLTSGTPGLYACTATNTWTAPSGGGGSGTTPVQFSPTGTSYTVTHNLGYTRVILDCIDANRIVLGSSTPAAAVKILGWQTAANGNSTTVNFDADATGSTCWAWPFGAIGAKGDTGAAGANGTNGQSVTATTEAAGTNCTYGGVKFVSASGTNYACNGAPGTGTMSGPGSSTTNHIPQFSDTSGAVLKDGLGLVTSVGSPGADTNVPTEKAVRTALAASGGSMDATGGYWIPWQGETLTASSSMTQYRLYLFKMPSIPASFAANGIAFRLNTGVNPSNLMLCIYDNTGTGGAPSALVAASSAVSITSTAAAWRLASLSTTANLSGGTYWFGIISDTAGNAFSEVSNGNWNNAMAQLNGVLTANWKFEYRSDIGSFSCPSTLSAITAINTEDQPYVVLAH